MRQEDELQEKEEIRLSDKDIFLKIWSSPRMVFKYINDFKYEKYVTVLLILTGISSAFDRATTKNMGDDLSLIAVLSICIVLGGLLGWISIYIYAALMSWTGKWINGQGNTNSLVRMTAYAMIPSIVALVFLIPQIVLFGNSIFQSEMDVNNSGLLSIVILYVTVIFEIILGIWTIVIFVIGISEVQKISIGKSILNMIMPVLLFLIPIALIVLIFS